MNSNSDNPKVGKAFQLAVKEWFEQARKVPYQMEKAIPIGTPGKNHKFDLAEAIGNVVVECKMLYLDRNRKRTQRKNTVHK